MSERLERISEAADSPDCQQVLEQEFTAIRGKSIDFAVMERAAEAGDVVVIEAPFQWDDVGSWRALERLGQPDQDENVVQADKHLEIGTTGTIARSNAPNHAIVLVGVRDLVVITTPDATLVANKHDEESIRKVAKLIEERGWYEYL
jgi:mannose-1-phosphate guanylyltransferase